jgi:fucose permease
VALGLMSFFFYCGAEASVFLWAASFLVGLRGAGAEQAAGWASMYLIGMTVGRLVSGLVADRIGGKNMIRLGQAICVLGIVMMFIPNLYVAVASLFVLGLGCAPIYPMTIHETPRRFGEENSANLVGLQMACAYTGSTLVPPVLGFVCGHVGMIALPVLQVVFLAGQVYCSETLNRRIANK